LQAAKDFLKLLVVYLLGKIKMAKKNLNMDKVKFFDPKGLRKVAERHRKLFHVRVTEKGKDYKGNQFKSYSKEYDDLLSRDFRKKDGGRYAGFEGTSLETSGTKRSKHTFILRGDTMANFHVSKVVRDHYVLSWTGEAGAIVDGNAKEGRNIKDGIPDDEQTYVVNQLGLLIDKEFKKIPNVTRIKT